VRDDPAVTREQAMQRVRKLQAVTVQRGATPPEAATAAERAARLVARFAVQDPPAAARPRPPAQAYATAARADRRSSRSLRFVGFA
jgi:hypothetical protein